MNHNARSLLSLALTCALASACGSEGDINHDGDDTDALAETKPGPAPFTGEMLNWATAAIPGPGAEDDKNSDFMRSQAIMSELATWAYKSPEDFGARSAPAGLYPVKWVDADAGGLGVANVQAMLGVTAHAKMAFVSIRGSQENDDWLEDLFIVPTAPADMGGPVVTMHKGFWNYAEKVYQELRNTQLANACAPMPVENRIPLWITGHSLGGAAASMLALKLASEGCNVRGVSTFGSPRPGLRDFQDLYNSIALPDGTPLAAVTNRWVYDKDPIPCLFPGNAWRHVGRHNRVLDDNSIKLNDGNDECSTPDGWIGKVKKAADFGLQLGEYTGATLPLAAADWVHDHITLGILCRDDANWDDYVSLGLCKAVEYGSRLKDAYQLDPATLIIEIYRLKYHRGEHDTDFYNAGIFASYDQPVVPTVNITMTLPTSVTANAPAMYDESGATCRAELSGDNWVCVFPEPVGSEAKIHIAVRESDTSYLHTDCPGSFKNSTDFVCTIRPSVDRQYGWYPYY